MKFFIFLTFLLNCSQTIFATDCPFCTKEIKNQVVYETDFIQILVDYAPRVKGHLLIIPKRHVVKAHELSKEEWNDISQIIPKIVKIFEQVLHTNEYVILEKNGRHAFQQVPHVHFHLLPIHSQSWGEIFNVDPQILPEEELKSDVDFFKYHFSTEFSSSN